MKEDAPYTRKELENRPDTFPDRGPLCPRCETRIPQFAELNASGAAEVIRLDTSREAMELLSSLTGCSERFAKIWLIHSGKPSPPKPTAPCPFCGLDLITPQAKQCRHCFMDWHNPDRPYNLRTKEIRE